MQHPSPTNGVPSDLWGRDQAERYDSVDDPMFAPELLDATSGFLAELAGDGRALEFAIGTGRVAIPLRDRGVDVAGIEFSPAMADVLRAKAPDLPGVVGDMATSTVDGTFALAYLVFNTIGNLYEQDAQVQCFRNAARHLTQGGHFVIEVEVPALRRMPPGQTSVPFDVSAAHLGFDEYDITTQRAISHHYSREPDGRFGYHPHHYRYVWPSELDLMAQLAGLEFVARYADWSKAPFTAASESHVSVWRKP